MKKILLLNYEFPPLGGGAANATYHLLNEFAKNKNIQIDLITSSTNKYREEQFSDNIRIYFLDIGKKGNLHYQSNKDLLAYSLKAYRFAKELIKEKQYDLVHAFFGIPCGYIAMKLGLPYVVSLRGSDVPFYNKRFYLMDKFLFKRLSKKIWKRAKSVIANSGGLKELACKSAPQQNIRVIYNGVDINKFQSNQKSETLPAGRQVRNQKFTVLYVGRLIKRKGVKYLIDAFAKLNAQNDCRLLIAGTGNLEDKLKKQVVELNQTKSVYFFGAVPHSVLPQIYRQSDVFVLPSFNEGMSNTMLEAMASGLPIVATDTGGTKELIKGNGMIIDKGSSDSILQALKTLKANKRMREEFGLNSSIRAREMGWGKIAEKYLNIY